MSKSGWVNDTFFTENRHQVRYGLQTRVHWSLKKNREIETPTNSMQNVTKRSSGLAGGNWLKVLVLGCDSTTVHEKAAVLASENPTHESQHGSLWGVALLQITQIKYSKILETTAEGTLTALNKNYESCKLHVICLKIKILLKKSQFMVYEASYIKKCILIYQNSVNKMLCVKQEH